MALTSFACRPYTQPVDGTLRGRVSLADVSTVADTRNWVMILELTRQKAIAASARVTLQTL